MSLEIMRLRYEDDELNSDLIFRIRPISMSKKNYESAVKNSNIIDKDNILKLIPRNDFNKILFKEKLPLTSNLTKFGLKLSEKFILNGKEMPGELYIYY